MSELRYAYAFSDKGKTVIVLNKEEVCNYNIFVFSELISELSDLKEKLIKHFRSIRKSMDYSFRIDRAHDWYSYVLILQILNTPILSEKLKEDLDKIIGNDGLRFACFYTLTSFGNFLDTNDAQVKIIHNWLCQEKCVSFLIIK